MSRIDEEEAASTLQLLTELGEMQAELADHASAEWLTLMTHLKALYPFLQAARRTPTSENAALLESVAQKARHSVDIKREFFETNAQQVVDTARAVADVYRATVGSSRWATAARAATPRTSRSSSFTRSPPAVRRSAAIDLTADRQ